MDLNLLKQLAISRKYLRASSFPSPVDCCFCCSGQRSDKRNATSLHQEISEVTVNTDRILEGIPEKRLKSSLMGESFKSGRPDVGMENIYLRGWTVRDGS